MSYQFGSGPLVPVKHEVSLGTRLYNATLIEELLGEEELQGIKVELENWGYVNKYSTQIYGKKNWVCPVHHVIHSSNNWVASQPHPKKKVHVQITQGGKRTKVTWMDFLPDAHIHCYHVCKASCKHKNKGIQSVLLNGPLLL